MIIQTKKDKFMGKGSGGTRAIGASSGSNNLKVTANVVGGVKYLS